MAFAEVVVPVTAKFPETPSSQIPFVSLLVLDRLLTRIIHSLGIDHLSATKISFLGETGRRFPLPMIKQHSADGSLAARRSPASAGAVGDVADAKQFIEVWPTGRESHEDSARAGGDLSGHFD